MNLSLDTVALEVEATRERLRAGTLLTELRKDSPPGLTLRTDEELDESLAQSLASHDRTQDVLVFGYGSLMWNPALDYSHVYTARLHGWHRRFCLRLLIGRGSLETPGVMLALDRGGSCTGRVFRIPADKVNAELRLLWRREMLAGSYSARWVDVSIDGCASRAITFVIDRRHPRYIGGLPMAQIAHLLRTGQGTHGTSLSYFDALSATLEQMNIRDAGIERLRAVLSLSAV